MMQLDTFRQERTTACFVPKVGMERFVERHLQLNVQHAHWEVLVSLLVQLLKKRAVIFVNQVHMVMREDWQSARFVKQGGLTIFQDPGPRGIANCVKQVLILQNGTRHAFHAPFRRTLNPRVQPPKMLVSSVPWEEVTPFLEVPPQTIAQIVQTASFLTLKISCVSLVRQAPISKEISPWTKSVLSVHRVLHLEENLVHHLTCVSLAHHHHMLHYLARLLAPSVPQEHMVQLFRVPRRLVKRVQAVHLLIISHCMVLHWLMIVFRVLQEHSPPHLAPLSMNVGFVKLEEFLPKDQRNAKHVPIARLLDRVWLLWNIHLS